MQTCQIVDGRVVIVLMSLGRPSHRVTIVPSGTAGANKELLYYHVSAMGGRFSGANVASAVFSC